MDGRYYMHYVVDMMHTYIHLVIVRPPMETSRFSFPEEEEDEDEEEGGGESNGEDICRYCRHISNQRSDHVS